MKFIIRSCNDRLWYVKSFLIPDLLNQGIEENDIIHINDDDSNGCLDNWLHACSVQLSDCANEKGVWHLQDDVLISDDFKDIALSIPDDVVCNGFVTEDFNPNEIYCIGRVNVFKYWYSFQCIYIPNRYIKHFLAWYYQKVYIDKKYQYYVYRRRYDDRFFWQFMKEEYPNDTCLNIVPNIVQHVDDLLGGSIANNDVDKRKYQKAKSFYWNESEKEIELIEKIRRFKNDC